MARPWKQLVPHVAPTEEQRSEGKVGSCRDCGAEWPERLFVRRIGRCLNCAREYARLAQEKRRGVDRLDKLYGLPIDEQKRLREAGCAICSTPESSLGRKLNADHDHKTGEFRGFLCTLCNSGLGFFRDDLERMRAAIRYLEEHSTRAPRPRQHAVDPVEKLIERRFAKMSAAIAPALDVDVTGGKVTHSWNQDAMAKVILNETYQLPSHDYDQRPIRSLSDAMNLVGTFRDEVATVEPAVGQVWVDARFAWKITRMIDGSIWLERLDGKQRVTLGGESALRRFFVYDPSQNRSDP